VSDWTADEYSEAIAIVGMTGRFPGARNVDEFWRNLRDGVESITFFTAEELAGSGIERSLLDNPRYVGADGVIEDMDLFDAEFFGIVPSEAELMDPQHRLFLECAWEVLEQAGYDSETYAGRVAVYGSANLSTYLIRNIMSHPGLRERATSFQTLITNDKDFIATRVSYKMNLRGPSMSVATLCSSSFVAIHLASQALLNYQCDLALAGAISLQASRNEAFFYQEGGIGDPDGHCRAFDAGASGTVSGSGIGLVALKRLADAVSEGDHIHAVIRGMAVNNDGAVKYSYTAPSVEGQAEVIAEAISLAGVDPETITYVETHGTGTRLGDPIEVAALTKAFRGCGARKKQYCAIGSVKTNIGHLVNAGGVASLIKTILALQHGQIPASLNFEAPNPEIDFADSPFYVNTRLSDWQTEGFPRRAGVSSFGIGGTNVHLIVEEAPEPEPSGESRSWQLLLLSARTASALEAATANLVEYLRQHGGVNLADVAYTLQAGRRAFSHRRALLCRRVEEAIEALSEGDPARVLDRFQESKNRPVAFMFPDVGEQRVNAGRELYESEPTFGEQVDRCAEILGPDLKLDLRRVLYPGEGEGEEAERQLERPVVAQAALFVVEYALAQLWLEWGVRPQAVIGEGVGEYVAACLAGVLSLADALAWVAAGRPVERERLSAAAIPCVSSVSGEWLTEAEATEPDYWMERVGRSMRLSDRLSQLLKEPEQVLLAVGPGEGLSRLAQEHPARAARQVVLASMRQGQEQRSEVAHLLETLGRLWLAGVQVDWYGFQAHERRRRLPLPTYPFERQRYWIEPHEEAGQRATGGAPQAAKAAVARKPDVADWFYVPGWKTSPLPRDRDWTEDEGSWLLFVDECGTGAAMAGRLRRAGQDVTTVTVGERFSRLESGLYALNPRQRADYAALFEELRALGRIPRRIVHLWSVTPNRRGQSDVECFKQAQDRGFYSLLFLAQALGEYVLTDAVQLWVVSNNVQQVESADVPYPEKATILGPCKVIPQENPRVTCHHLDVVLPESSPLTGDGLGRQLLAEIGADLPDPVVAYRGNRRWLQVFEAVQLTAGAEPIRPLRENGVYLVTSGLADISLALADYLVRTVRAKLVLIEGETFPSREQWAQWLESHGRQDQVGRKIQDIRSLEDAGAQVLVVNTDLTDAAQMQGALAQATTRLGKLDGVIHAVGDMGVNTFRTVQDTGYAEGVWLFESRMRGLSVLEEALAGRDLDFCLLVSSLASILGGLGQAAYAAANLFMDAFVAGRGAPWLSVNWDAWQFEAERGRIAALTPRLAQFAISPVEGGEAFRRILSSHTGHQIVVSTGDLKARMRQWLDVETLQAPIRVEEKSKRYARPQIPTPYVAPTSELERIIVEVWQETMGIEQIGIDDNFFDLGGDSLIAVKTIAQLEGTLQRKVPTANLYQTPSIRALAGLLAQDETQSAQQRATRLDQRKEELSRRNIYLHRRRKG
jgi:acyl transferase domain-containing protein/acyl carrier protein